MMPNGVGLNRVAVNRTWADLPELVTVIVTSPGSEKLTSPSGETTPTPEFELE
jgi:hypothetical protein